MRSPDRLSGTRRMHSIRLKSHGAVEAVDGDEYFNAGR